LKDGKQNLIKGLWTGVDTEDSLVYNYTDRLVSTVGVNNSIVIVTDDIVLVADKSDPDQIKKLIKELEQNPKLKKYL
jgi:mannose-1-phosphate guanylyltransferase